VGHVLTPDTFAPIRGAKVTASGANGSQVETVSDGNGAYRLDGLATGDWHITASKAGYVDWEFGQRRPFQSPPPVALSRGQEFTADIPLTRGGAISGQISDQMGLAVAGLQIRVYRARMERGLRRLEPVGPEDLTDDRGAFRVYGLPPGDYYVAASVRMAPVDSVVETTYSPTYYPGASSLAEAQHIRLGLGTEANASFALLASPPARVSGVVMSSSGSPVDAYLNLVSEASELGVPVSYGGVARGDGTFTLSDVPPGQYTLTATSRGDGPDESGSLEVTVNGDLTGITLVTGPPAALRGTIVAADNASAPPPAGVEVTAISTRAGGTILGAGSGRRFEIGGIAGPFQLSVAGLPDQWAVSQITVNGLDVTDGATELTPGQVGEVRIVVTNRLTEVAGMVEGGEASAVRSVIVFPEDSAKWGPRSRYLRMTRVREDGSFRIPGLPPDERYLAVATDYLEEGEQTDPAFFSAMRGLAAPFSLGEQEVRRVDLRVVPR